MSFYFDDDEPQVDNDEDFCCVTCGGPDYYVDPVSGALCCNSCFTQSQQMTQENSQLDVEEVQALAARTSSGRVVGTTNRRRGGQAFQQEKKPLQEYDTSTPFPNLITCLHGIQRVMKHCIGPLCDLVGLSDEKEQVEETVKSLWMSYLRAWTDGAEFYGKLHPEIRFSLRDYFLPTQYKTKILKHLSHKAAQLVRAELDAGDEEKKDESSVADERGSDESEDDKGLNHSSLKKSHQETIRHFASTYHNPKSLIWMYWHRGKRGRLESALISPPSMNFVACLLWLTVSRAGVTLNHVLQWIANGALPLQNAFKHCLSEQEQQALIHVASFFRLTKLPALSQMESLADKLVVACGLKSFAHLHGIPAAADKPDTVVSSRDRGTTTSEIRKRPDFSYVTPRSVPLMAARFINDFGFRQEVLHRTLALMGILKEAPSNMWLPAPLESALPKNLATTAQVLAVIATACRMTPGWETWVYPGPSAFSNDMVTTVDEDSLEYHEEERKPKRRRIQSESNRFVPYNEEHFRQLRNGPLVEGYLDFLEENILDEKEEIFPAFRSKLEIYNGEEQGFKSTCTEEGVVVRKQPALKESRNPFGPERIWRRQKLHDWKLQAKRKRARWADANGLGEYVIYDDPLTHASDRNRVGKKKFPIPEPFHPQYGLLIEFMSYKANVKASKIHAAITVLDEEVLRLVGPKEEPKRKYTRKAPMQKENQAWVETDAAEEPRRSNEAAGERDGDAAVILSSANVAPILSSDMATVEV